MSKTFHIADWVSQRYTYDEFKTERSVADFNITLPTPPAKTSIDGYNKPKNQQKFEAEEIPKGFTFWGENEKDAYLEKLWYKRINGHWFYNNGNLEYITGLHWFYLNYWKFPVVRNGRKKLGLPFFTDSDRDYFYIWDYCYTDTKCLGLVHATNRRDGKTFRSTCTSFELLSKTPDSRAGTQSKNLGDAKKVFGKLVKSWQSLPYFWKPVDVGETHPQRILRFEEPGKRDTKSKGKEYKEVLNSSIDFGTAKEEHYDGEGLFFYYMDEAGKCTESDVSVTWEISKECLMDGATVTGKGLITTTVEEMERKGGKNFKRIWDASDQNKKNPLGQTESGLFKYFKPAYYGFRGEEEDGKGNVKSYVDKYGYSNCEAALDFLQKRRSILHGSSLSAQMRKYPFEEKEMFVVDSKFCPWDTDRIYQQIDHNDELSEHMLIRGNFYWLEKDKEVGWQPSKNGRWLVSELPKVERRNAHAIVHRHKAPANTNSFACGSDPFDHKTTVDSKKSLAGAFVKKKFNPLEPDRSNYLVCQYHNRPPTPEMFYEDMIMMCLFYGTEILAETNRPGLVNYFRQRGYYKYLMKRPENTQTNYSKKQLEPGIPMSGEAARNSLIDEVVTEVHTNLGYIEKEGYMSKNYFNDLMYELIDFEVDNWTPYDLVVAYGLTLLACKKNIIDRSVEKKAYPLIKLKKKIIGFR